VERRPQDPEAYYHLGVLSLADGRMAEALGLFRKALALKPRDGRLVAMIARIHMMNNELPEAAKLIEAQLPSTDDKALLYALQGEIALQRGSLPDAEENMKKALDLDPSLLEGYVLLGAIYVRQQAQEKAIEAYRALARQKPRSPLPHMLIGMMQESKGRLDEARVSYEKALDIQPDFAPAANNLAWLYAENLDDLDRALFWGEKAREGAPADPFVADTLGWVYEKKGDLTKARALLEEAALKLPDNPSVRYHLGATYHALGEKERAGLELRRALEISTAFPEAEKARALLTGITVNR